MRGKGETDADGRPILAFTFYYGNAAYYMSERDTWEREEPSLDRLLYLYQDNDNQIGNGYYDAETAYEKFGFRVILWDCAPLVLSLIHI